MKRWQLARAVMMLGLFSMANFSQADELSAQEQPWSEQILSQATLLNLEPGLLNAIYLQSAKQNPEEFNQNATISLPQRDDRTMYVFYKGDVYWVIFKADPTVFMSRAPDQDFRLKWEKQRIQAYRLPNADPATFTELDFGYAKDQRQVYNWDKVITDADPQTFQVMSSFYVKDAHLVYFRSASFDSRWPTSATPPDMIVIRQADPLTFDVIDKKATHVPNFYYAKDSQHVYFAGEIMPKVEPNTFSIVQPYSTYSTDNQAVYLNGNLCTGVDVNSFEALSYWIIRDKHNVYVLCRVLKGLDANSFELLSSTSGSPALLKDKNGVYWVKIDGSNKESDLSNWAEQKIPGADPKTFQLLISSYNRTGLYGQDNKQVYYYTKPILGADPNTFQMLRDDSYGVDKKQLYEYGKPVSTAEFKNNFYNLYAYLDKDSLYPIAIKYLSQILAQKNDGYADVYYLFRAEAYTAQGEFEKAISDYKNAIRLLKRKSDENYKILNIYMKFIPLHIKLKQYDLARKNIAQAETFINKNGRCDQDLDKLNELKADIYAAQGKRDEALKIYQTIKSNINSCYQNTTDQGVLSWIEAINHKLEQRE